MTGVLGVGHVFRSVKKANVFLLQGYKRFSDSQIDAYFPLEFLFRIQVKNKQIMANSPRFFYALNAFLWTGAA